MLFIRGADRSGGFLEAGNDFGRTEQLSDINNASTSPGNHGWSELRETLESAGFVVEQWTETAETASGPSQGAHIDFETYDLSVYDAVVFGSNNAVYDTAAVDAIETYVPERWFRPVHQRRELRERLGGRLELGSAVPRPLRTRRTPGSGHVRPLP